MNDFLVIIKEDGETTMFLISADDINYTTNAVCLMVEYKTVAYFRRDNVISISPYDSKIKF